MRDLILGRLTSLVSPLSLQSGRLLSDPPIDLLVALDLRDGVLARSSQKKVSWLPEDLSPFSVAHNWVSQGATWIHMVDLNAALAGKQCIDNQKIMLEIAQSLNANVEISGGITDEDSLCRALKINPERVNLSTESLRCPAWVQEVLAENLSTEIGVCLDVVGDLLWPRGSESPVGKLEPLLDFLNNCGCKRFIVTDSRRDGRLAGVPWELLVRVNAATMANLTFSGGIAEVDEIKMLRSFAPGKLDSVIVGKALYDGVFALRQALRVASE